jgi:RNA polymerase sigma-70 factor, ECF subfamily
MQGTMQIAQANVGSLARTQADEAGEAGLTLEQAFSDHKELVFRAAYRVTGNASDAEDVLQTVFLRLLRQPQQPDIRNLRAYLHRAAVNAALDLLRVKRESHNLALDDQPQIAGPASAATELESNELRGWLRQALARLNPRWAEMFVLRFIEDLSNPEIARLMKTSTAVVAVVLHRTRAQLRKDYAARMRGRL